MDLSKLLKQAVRVIDANSPTILTGLGVVGLVTTVIMAVKATPKALQAINDWEESAMLTEDPSEFLPMQPKEIIQATWKYYIPTAGMGLTTIACMIFAHKINLRRNAALASLYSIAETTLKEYQTKVVETIGQNKEEKIREEIAQDHVDKHVTKGTTTIVTGHGDYLCFDEFSQRSFRSNIEFIQRQVNRFNQHLLREGWLNINEFYDLLDLSPIALGDEYGWIAERSMLELKLYTRLAKDTQEPCLVIDYMDKPTHI